MNEKAFHSLELQAIRDKLSSLASCEISIRQAAELPVLDDIEEIEKLLTETDEAVNLIYKHGSPPSAGVRDISHSVRHAEAAGMLSLKEFLEICGLLTAVRRLRRHVGSDLTSLAEETPAATDETGQNGSSGSNMVLSYIAGLTEIKSLEDNINRCIISDTEIADEASYELSDIRHKILNAQNSIKEKLNDMTRSSKYSKALQDNVVTMRMDRYCVPVKADCRSEVPGIVHDTSSSGQTLFIEPTFVVDANNKIKALRVAEKEEIERIIRSLSEEVAVNGFALLENLRLISYIDLVFAKARMAIDMKAVKPSLRTDGTLNLIKARHPLIDPKKVVPVDIYLGEQTEAERQRIQGEQKQGGMRTTAMVITGPNTGGKTVTLKTVGLLTLMMQSGLLVTCAEHSVMTVYTGVYADIGDEQSIAQSLSTFSAHMTNITTILKNCDSQSLVLFDELGAGTDPTEGAALAMAILECVRQIGATVFATTHYSELKIFASTTPGFINAACEFDVETLRPTYRLLIGVPGKSNAFAISEKLGLDPQIIARSKEFLSSEDLRFEDMLSGIERHRTEIEKQRQDAERMYREAQQLRAEAEDERQRLRIEQSEILEKARLQAREAAAKARVSAEKLLTELRRAAIDNSQESVRRAEEAKREFEDEISDNIGDIASSVSIPAAGSGTSPSELKEGEAVRILSLNCEAVVLKAPDANDSVYLQAGAMKMYMPLSDLTRISSKKQSGTAKKAINSSSSNTKGSSMMKAVNIRSEIDVRGMNVEEATMVLDRQINDGMLAKQSTFTVIHGKGTGALRKGVHEYLRHNKSVSDFRLGTFGEGDTGVTVVTLK